MINPYHLRYFVDAARGGSLSEAAKKNRVSQSAVSQAIRSLEKVLGFELSTHQKKVFHLTDEGKAVLEQADGVFQSLARLAEAIRDTSSGYSGSLTIGCTNTVALGVLTPVLARLATEHPKLVPQVRIGNSEVIKDWLHRKEIDVGIFVDDGLVPNEFRKTVLRSGVYALFRGRARPSGEMGLVVTRRERSEVQYYLRHLARASKAVRIQCEITSWEAIKNYVLRTGGYGLCPDYVIADDLAAKRLVLERPSFKAPSYRLIAVHRANQPIGKNARLLIESLAGGRTQVDA